MKVLIIEDEHPASQKLVRMLNALDKGIEVLAVIESVEDATNWFIRQLPPDLVFMDVQLEDGLCFEIFEHVDVRVPVVFTTAYDEYALQAFRVNSVDYLLKPLETDALSRALEKYRSIHQRPQTLTGMQVWMDGLRPRTKERFLIRAGDHYKSIPVSDIGMFYIRERCTFLLTAGGRSFALDHSLERIEAMVDAERFFRVNRNAIVHFRFILDIVAYSSNRLKIKMEGWNEPEVILVSRDRVAGFKAWMDR